MHIYTDIYIYIYMHVCKFVRLDVLNKRAVCEYIFFCTWFTFMWLYRLYVYAFNYECPYFFRHLCVSFWVSSSSNLPSISSYMYVFLLVFLLMCYCRDIDMFLYVWFYLYLCTSLFVYVSIFIATWFSCLFFLMCVYVFVCLYI